jgi:hypothetical protein
MSDQHANAGQNANGRTESLAEELRRESERLQALAAKLKARELELAEMEINYPYFKAIAYAKLREQFASELLDIPEGTDLLSLPEAQGAVSSEELMRELGFDDDER